MRQPINHALSAERESMSPAAWCIHRIHISPSARKHGLSTRQREMIASCTRVLTDHDMTRLAAMGYALDRAGDVEEVPA